MKKFLILLGITLFIARIITVDLNVEPRDGEYRGYTVAENSEDNTEGSDGMDMKDNENPNPPT